MRRLAAAAVMAVAGEAASFELALPVDCRLGKTCFLQNYVDHDPGPGAADPFCGPRSYDGHKGSDFRLPDLAAMTRGVDVLAAAPGIVRGLRDGMADTAIGTPDAPDIAGRECGNGVILQNDHGWSTQYCHLKQGSIAVAEGQRVAAGQVLGQIGLSGMTSFPHLHLTVRWQDEVIDPFSRQPMETACDPAAAATLWSAQSGVTYQPGGVLSAGITTSVPDYAEVNAESPHRPSLPADAPAMVAWGHYFGVEKDDVLVTSLIGPDGAVIVTDSHVMAKNRASQYRAIGRRIREGGWTPGTYTGRSELRRGGKLIARREVSAEIP
ncbi:M23 family metallopeptidase [Rhodobacteraceae bacterium NNCM2]|nr:M23 family metallopeptidase [Coraliihabitans acroporae]